MTPGRALAGLCSLAVALLLSAAACETPPPVQSRSTGPETAARAGSPSPVTVAATPEGTTYTVVEGSCRVTWVLRAEQINRGVVMHRPSCALTLAEQAPLIGRILDTIAADATSFGSMRTLHWGRLLPDGARDTTLSARLALAAIRSPGWDARRGRPKVGDPNEFVRAALNQAGMFTELEDVFAGRGLSLSVASVEKVLASRVVDLPFFTEIQRAGLAPADRVPWDAQVWFSIHR